MLLRERKAVTVTSVFTIACHDFLHTIFSCFNAFWAQDHRRSSEKMEHQAITANFYHPKVSYVYCRLLPIRHGMHRPLG